jgi:diketogulonate reductase-like aldo/keto reductase
MEQLVDQGMVRCLGISNVSANQLRLLIDQARIQPHFVQNRCYASLGWDRAIRNICRDSGVLYQGFSLLTANVHIFRDRQFMKLVKAYGCTSAQLIYSFALKLGMIVLTGTTNSQHMSEALASTQVELNAKDVSFIESIAA